METLQKLPLYTFALISECALNYNTGLINSNGSPFNQLRKAHPELQLPRNKKRALLEIKDKLSLYELPSYFLKTIEQINTGKPIEITEYFTRIECRNGATN